MRIILFGATGMVGQGALRECLLDPDVSEVMAIGRTPVGRTPVGQTRAKLREQVVPDPGDLSSIEDQLGGYDACFFCLGVSSAGMNEAAYRRITYDLTLAAARTLSRLNPGMTFIYVSGTGTDSSERGRSMWARVKGQTENALLALPFKAAYMFRPGVIQPLHGVVSRTPLYRAFYFVLGLLLPLLRILFPRYITTTENLGRAMLVAAKRRAPRPVVENNEIDALGAGARVDAATLTT